MKKKYETCDLMHGDVCVSEPCICKGMAMSEKRKQSKNDECISEADALRIVRAIKLGTTDEGVKIIRVIIDSAQEKIIKLVEEGVKNKRRKIDAQ